LFSWQLPIQITNLHIGPGAYGKDCDSSVSQETSFFKLLIRNELHIPPSGPLFTNDTESCPFVFVGDEAFSFMRPYTGHNLSKKQRKFNDMSGMKIR